jgi:hypothetical protein
MARSVHNLVHLTFKKLNDRQSRTRTADMLRKLEVTHCHQIHQGRAVQAIQPRLLTPFPLWVSILTEGCRTG